MDALFAVGWANYPSKEDNDLYNVFAIAPTENFWFLNNKITERKVFLLRYVKEYLELIQRNNKHHNFTFLTELYKNNKFIKNIDRVLIGCTVNISALGSTVAGCFDINKILYKEPNGYLHPNRQRNAALHICLRTNSPNVYSLDKIDKFIKKSNLNIKNLYNNDNNTKKKVVGDRVIRSSKTYIVSPKLLGDKDSRDHLVQQPHIQNASSSSKSCHHQDNNSLFNLFSCYNKPRDQTYLTYPSGSFVLTGAKEPYMSLYSQWILTNLFTIEGIPITHLNNFSIQNIVSTFRIPISIDLSRLEKRWGQNKIKYSNIQFPAAIYTIEKQLVEIAIERANIIKEIKRKIIEDNSHKSAEEVHVDELVDQLVRSYDAHKIKENFKNRFVFKKNNPYQKLLDGETVHDPEYIEDINKEIEKTIHQDLEDNAVISQPLLKKSISKNNPVALIYRTGAIVTTGSNDIDFEIALFEILYDMLLYFKSQCEEEDKNIADSYSNVINLDKNTSTSTALIVQDKKKKDMIKKSQQTIGVAEKGTFMRKMSLKAQMNHMTNNAKKQSYSDAGRVGYNPVGNDNHKTNKPNDDSNALIVASSAKRSSSSKFYDLVHNDNKRQRND